MTSSLREQNQDLLELSREEMLSEFGKVINAFPQLHQITAKLIICRIFPVKMTSLPDIAADGCNFVCSALLCQAH